MKKYTGNNVLVKMENMGAKRDDRWIVRHVDLEIRQGEIVTIIGPNGSGKSTTLKLLSQTVPADEGSIEQFQKIKTAYVPQSLSIDKVIPLSVSGFLNMSVSVNQIHSDKMLDRFQIAHLRNNQVHSLSGGEFNRMLLARAFLQNPNLLILDEPSQGVDFSGQIELYKFVREFRDETGAAIVMVSHDLHLVMAATDKVLCINGHVCCSGTPQNIANSPDYLNLLGPTAADALAIYRHNHDHVHLADGRVQHKDGTITHDCHPGDGHHHNQAG